MSTQDNDYCSDCKKSTEVVYDHAVGDSICVECGLVLESRIVDETPEWRIFANDDGSQDTDPVRVGAPSNLILNQSFPLLETTITNVKDPQNRIQIPKIGFHSDNKSHKSFIQAFNTIDELCERLALNKLVKDLACDMYSKIKQLKTTTRNDTSFLAACVYIACQKQNQFRTLKEIRIATNGQIEQKNIVTSKNTIIKLLNNNNNNIDIITKTDQHVSDYLKRFGYEIELSNNAIKAALEMLKKCEEVYIKRTPKTIAVGIVYVICLLCGNGRSVKDISIVANVSEVTIKKSYKDLYPHLLRIVPRWFASESDVMKLYVP